MRKSVVICCLLLPVGAKDRLKSVAKYQEGKYHTLATDYVLNSLRRAEKKMQSELNKK
jgi:hypothetical protein